MPKITVSLAIAADVYLATYQGAAQNIVARSNDGQVVRFPAVLLRRFITGEGIYGNFAIEFDEQHRFKSISRQA